MSNLDQGVKTTHVVETTCLSGSQQTIKATIWSCASNWTFNCMFASIFEKIFKHFWKKIF